VATPSNRAERPPFRLPTAREHLADLRARPAALTALLHNALPVFGIFVFGWSLPLVVFTYWFDGFAGLATILAALLPRLLREVDETKHRGVLGKAFYGGFTWAILVAFLGLPYWIVLVPLGGQIFAPEVLAELRGSVEVWAALAAIVAGHAMAARKRGYGGLPETALKQALRWDVYLLVLRALAMFVVAGNVFPFLVVPVLALVFTYMEIWPAHALGIVFGDPTRLHEDGPGDRKPATAGTRKGRLPR
jgi:hypothetical protein